MNFFLKLLIFVKSIKKIKKGRLLDLFKNGFLHKVPFFCFDYCTFDKYCEYNYVLCGLFLTGMILCSPCNISKKVIYVSRLFKYGIYWQWEWQQVYCPLRLFYEAKKGKLVTVVVKGEYKLSIVRIISK